MQSKLKSLGRFCLIGSAVLAFTAGTLGARPREIRGGFRDTGLIEPILSAEYSVLGIHLDIASTGCVSFMCGPVVSLTNDQVNKLMPSDGATLLNPGQTGLLLPDATMPPYTGVGTYTLRDATGDSILLTFSLVMDRPGKHEIMFHGTMTVVGGTGRYAGVTSKLDAITCTGWADYDAGSQASFAGGWEISGIVDVPAPGHCGGCN